MRESTNRRADGMNITRSDGTILRAITGDSLIWADLRGANLRGANLSGLSLCRATIDGAIVSRDDIGGPGWILYAMTDVEAEMIEKHRKAQT